MRKKKDNNSAQVTQEKKSSAKCIVEAFIGKETLLSFLSGIFSNIPISLLFAAPIYGTTFWTHFYFFCWLAAVIFSITLTVFSFSLTITIIEIDKEISEGMGAAGKAQIKEQQLQNNGKKLKRKITGCFLFAICTVLMVLLMAVITVLGVK